MFSFVKHISPHKFLGRKMKILGFAWGGELTLDDTMTRREKSGNVGKSRENREMSGNVGNCRELSGNDGK